VARAVPSATTAALGQTAGGAALPEGSTTMRLTMSTFLTLDGVMQAPGGPDEDRSGGFEHGGWLAPFADEDMGRAVEGWFGYADAFLLGRRTYDIFAAYWPHASDPDDPIANPLNVLPKYVVSTTLRSADWHKSTVISDNVVEEITKLKEQPGNELQVHGSGDLAQTLMAHDLIDEYRLFVYPVVLNTGKRLFRDTHPASLRLVQTQTTSTGVVISAYQPAGRPTYGTIGLE
jgi:dihydrofolate reductase